MTRAFTLINPLPRNSRIPAHALIEIYMQKIGTK